MSSTSIPSHLSETQSREPRRRETANVFDVALCGQCSVCQRYFPWKQLCVLQIQHTDAYQDTGRLICVECQRHMNSRAYQARELSRDEVTAALRQWLVQYQWFDAAPLSDA